MKAHSDIPISWWKKSQVCERFSKLFAQHIVLLDLVMLRNGEEERIIYSGFLLHWSKRLWWVTAGHVMQEIQEIRADKSISEVKVAWLDPTDPDPESNRIGFALKELDCWGYDAHGFDFGLSIIRPREVELLLKPGRLAPVNPKIWAGRNYSQPDGYYLIGCPASRCRNWRKDNRRFIEYAVPCLPVEKIPDRGACANEGLNTFWGCKEAFYGELSTFEYWDSPAIKKVNGMSGGMIISIERNNEGRMKYYLWGVQSLQLGAAIRATSVDVISELLNSIEGQI